MKICLIGGTGFIGRPITRRLMALGHEVSVLTRHRQRHRSMLVHPTLKLIQANVYDDTELDRYVSGMNIVINLTGILNQYGGPEHRFESVHSELPERIAHACVKHGVSRFIHMSALGADRDGPSEYQRSKGRGEDAVRVVASEHGLSVTIFRPSVVFGSEDDFTNRFAALLRSAPFLPLACPDTRFQPVFVDDVVNAFVGAINNPATSNQSYDLVGPDVYTLEEIVRYIDGLIGTGRKVFRLGERSSKILATLLQFAPGKPLTPDNVKSMTVDNVSSDSFPEIFGIEPTRLEQATPVYLKPTTDRLDLFRQRRG